MPLNVAPTNVPLIVRRVAGDERTRKHLASLGIVTDARMTILERTASSAICHVHESRIAISKDVAGMILVSC